MQTVHVLFGKKESREAATQALANSGVTVHASAHVDELRGKANPEGRELIVCDYHEYMLLRCAVVHEQKQGLSRHTPVIVFTDLAIRKDFMEDMNVVAVRPAKNLQAQDLHGIVDLAANMWPPNRESFEKALRSVFKEPEPVVPETPTGRLRAKAAAFQFA